MQYYWQSSNKNITIYNARAEDLLASLEPKSAELILTDPPYDEKTHKGARSANDIATPGKRLITFDSATEEDIKIWFTAMGRVAQSWVVSFTDWRHAAYLEQHPSTGLQFVRLGIWDKLGTGAPQYTGDRPAQGWEAISFLHRSRKRGEGRMQWYGGGQDAVYRYQVPRGTQRLAGHKAAKPPALMARLIREFTKSGDLVVDPFMGGSATAYSCYMTGRKCITGDMDEQWCEKVARLFDGFMPQLIKGDTDENTQQVDFIEEDEVE